MSKSKIRADQLLVEQGLAESRTQAQRLIMAGLVFTGQQRIEKPGQTISDETELTVRGKEHPYVSRGGVKLAKALEHFSINPKGLTCLDIGASTGGFTDVLLQNDAARVYAVDVGYGQLALKIRNDERVIVHDKTNARNLTSAEISEAVDMIVCDASFISLKTVLPAPLLLTKPQAQLVALIKPQFEVGPENLRKGVVKDPALHESTCEDIRAWLGAQPGNWRVQGIIESPLKGPAGNTEFLLYATR